VVEFFSSCGMVRERAMLARDRGDPARKYRKPEERVSGEMKGSQLPRRLALDGDQGSARSTAKPGNQQARGDVKGRCKSAVRVS
jgi:hypothetical protein